MTEFQILSKNAKGTMNIAKAMAPYCQLGDVLILDGDLGTGKTQFVKGFTSELGSPDLVTSPTFTIAQFYNIQNGSVLHIDAYRMSGIEEFRDTGLLDFFAQSIVLIEWGSKIVAEIEDYIGIRFENVPSNKNHRLLTFSYSGDKYAETFNLLSQQLSNLKK